MTDTTITHEGLVVEFTTNIGMCDDFPALVDLGVQLFGISYIDSVVKKCWGPFSQRVARLAPEDFRKSLVVVDLPAIFHASFATCGEDAISDTLSRIQSIDNELAKNSSLILAMDSDTSNRKAMCPQYKSSRTAKPAEFRDVRKEAIANLTNHSFTIVSHDGWESDDVMASAAFRTKLRKQTCVLVTDDRDMLQCCGSGVTCYSPRTHEYRSEQWLEVHNGLKPKQIVDWLCMMGKDDVPSVPGIGDKIAAKLIGRLGGFWGIFDSLDALVEKKELTIKKATAIREFARNDYFLAREMHTLNRSLKVDW